MANYQLEQTGAEVQALLNAVESPDTTPAAGSSNLITSGAVQAAVAGVSAEVTALGHEAVRNSYDNAVIVRLNELEQGSLNISGAPMSSVYRWRTKNFIQVPIIGGVLPKISVSLNAGYLVQLVCYDVDETRLGERAYISSGEFTLINNTTQIKLIFKPDPDRTFTEDMLLDMRPVLSFVGLDNYALAKNIQGAYDLTNELVTRITINTYFNRTTGEAVKYNGRVTINKYFLVSDGLIVSSYFSETNINKFFYASDFSPIGLTQTPSAVYFRVEIVYTDNVAISDYTPFRAGVFINGIAYSFDNYGAGTIIRLPSTDEINKLGADYECVIGSENVLPTIDKYSWIFGSILNNGSFTRTHTRICNPGFLPLRSAEYAVKIVAGYKCDIISFNASFTRLTETGWKSADFTFTPSSSTKYIRCMLANSDDSPITDVAAMSAAGFSITRKSPAAARNAKLPIKMGQWNVGTWSNGVTPTSMPDADLATAIPQLKEIFTKMGADILVLNEYTANLNRGDGGQPILNAYSTLLQQFFPYYYTGGYSIFVGSKYPMTLEEYTLGDRKALKGYTTIDGCRVDVFFLHETPFSASDRITDFTNLVALYTTAEKVIIAGDFNIGNNDESSTDIDAQMEVFTDAGFIPGNRGYWGTINTYSGNKALDNIFTKGFNYDSYAVGNNRSVSDHFPTEAVIDTLL